MTIAEIQHDLLKHHTAFNNAIMLLNAHDFSRSTDKKWNAGEQLDHIIRSTSPVLLAFRLPSFLPKLIFGTANRPSRSYEVLVEKYIEKLNAGGKASGRFIPSTVAFTHRKEYTDRLTKIIDRLSHQVTTFTEEDLDRLILPHPLLGKLTYREMLYFTIYHVQHHHKQLP